MGRVVHRGAFCRDPSSAARDGGRAVDLARVAAELQVSPSTLRRTLSSPDVLAECGVLWLARQRQKHRFVRKRPQRVPEGSLAHVRWILGTELPRDDEEVEWARAWAELTVTGAGGRIDELREDHDVWLDGVVTAAVAMLGTPVDDRPLEVVRLRALIDGVTTAVCAGRITPAQLEACIDLHLKEISFLPDAADGRPQPPHGRNSAESPNSCHW